MRPGLKLRVAFSSTSIEAAFRTRVGFRFWTWRRRTMRSIGNGPSGVLSSRGICVCAAAEDLHLLFSRDSRPVGSTQSTAPPTGLLVQKGKCLEISRRCSVIPYNVGHPRRKLGCTVPRIIVPDPWQSTCSKAFPEGNIYTYISKMGDLKPVHTAL